MVCWPVNAALACGQSQTAMEGVTVHATQQRCQCTALVMRRAPNRAERIVGARGYLVSWEVEKAVWWRALKGVLQVAPQDCGLLMTEPLFNLPLLQTSTMQVPAPLPCLHISETLCGRLFPTQTMEVHTCVVFIRNLSLGGATAGLAFLLSSLHWLPDGKGKAELLSTW